jgi:hypothetical protein
MKRKSKILTKIIKILAISILLWMHIEIKNQVYLISNANFLINNLYSLVIHDNFF